jgi:hypothetical protein
VVTDAAIVVQAADQASPAIDLARLNVTARIQRTDGGRQLVIEPATIFDRQKVTPELCRGGLQLVAPALADATNLEGEISLQLDRCVVPLDERDRDRAAQQTDIEGMLRLHQVSAGLNSPAIEEVLALISRILGLEIPQTIRVVDNTQLAFRVRDGRIVHEGLAFVLPEISSDLVVRTGGSVGLDESLDLQVAVQIPLTLIHDGPLSRKLSEHPFTLQVTGTLDQPRVRLPGDHRWLQEVAGLVMSQEPLDEEAPLANALIDVVGGLLERVEQSDAPLSTPILDRFRQRWRDRQDAGQQGPARPDARRPTPILDQLLGPRQGPPAGEEPSAEEPPGSSTPILDRIRSRRQRRPGSDPAADIEPLPPATRLIDRLRRRPPDPPDAMPP